MQAAIPRQLKSLDSGRLTMIAGRPDGHGKNVLGSISDSDGVLTA
jgi:hypothetical protein